MQTDRIVGWDIGGAHVKAALLDLQGHVIRVNLKSCPLWKGMGYLQQAVDSVLEDFPEQSYDHVITMTGELVDLFPSREQGVISIVQLMKKTIDDRRIFVYAGKSGFLKPDQLTDGDFRNAASANWLASASYAATRVSNGLFIDIGSTTTDILLLDQGHVQAQGFTDYQRLVSAELVYTGIVRTAVMAVAQEVEFNGNRMGLMAEYFATMADVYRLTGDLNEFHDLTDTADGAEKTVEASARRLSRMTGYDFNKYEMALWRAFAGQLKKLQKQKIYNACKIRISGKNAVNLEFVIGAGIGRFLVKELSAEMGVRYCDYNQLMPHPMTEGIVDSADCAPAVAVASLALQFLNPSSKNR